MTTNRIQQPTYERASGKSGQARQRNFPLFTVALVILVTGGLWHYGSDYYTLPLAERGDSPLHATLSPSAPVGRWLGIVGTLMMGSILLYPLRKKIRWLARAGTIRTWLSLHIFMGLMGPVLVTFHPGFKLGGVVAIAYWSMVVTALSGVFGRYVYIQIPRDAEGRRLSSVYLEAEARQIETHLALRLATAPGLLPLAVATEKAPSHTSTWTALKTAVWQDLRRPLTLRRLRQALRQNTALHRRQIAAVCRMAGKRSVLLRRIALSDAMEKVLHHWHVLHRPFVWIMFIVVALHIGVALLFGYAGL